MYFLLLSFRFNFRRTSYWNENVVSCMFCNHVCVCVCWQMILVLIVYCCCNCWYGRLAVLFYFGRRYFYTDTDVQEKKVAHSRLPSVGFQSWSRFLAVSLQVTWVKNRAVGCHYFLPGLQLPPQPLRGLLPILLFAEQRHNGCEQFA